MGWPPRSPSSSTSSWRPSPCSVSDRPNDWKRWSNVVVSRCRLAAPRCCHRCHLRGLPPHLRPLRFAVGLRAPGGQSPLSHHLPGELPGTVDVGELSLPRVVHQYAHHRSDDVDDHGFHGVGRRLCVLTVPVHRPPSRPCLPARDPDVSAAARVHCDLPPAADVPRRLSRHRAQYSARVDPRLLGRRVGRQHVPHVRLLQHRPPRDRRSGEDRRRLSFPNFPDHRAPPRRPRARRGRAAVLRGHVQRIPHRLPRAPGCSEADPGSRVVSIHFPATQRTVGHVRSRVDPRCDSRGRPVPIPAAIHRRGADIWLSERLETCGLIMTVATSTSPQVTTHSAGRRRYESGSPTRPRSPSGCAQWKTASRDSRQPTPLAPPMGSNGSRRRSRYATPSRTIASCSPPARPGRRRYTPGSTAPPSTSGTFPTPTIFASPCTNRRQGGRVKAFFTKPPPTASRPRARRPRAAAAFPSGRSPANGRIRWRRRGRKPPTNTSAETCPASPPTWTICTSSA